MGHLGADGVDDAGHRIAAEGLEPASADSQDHAESQQNSANSSQFSALAVAPHAADEQKFALPQQNASTSAHQKCALSVPDYHDLPEDLSEVVSRWNDLPNALKAHILEKVRKTAQK